MAAIEKVCEFSGEYPGPIMYKYKRNSLQIMPKYRKLFRGSDVRLIKLPKHEYFPNMFEYALVVKNIELQGEVDGRYENHSYDSAKKVLRKIRRLTRNYKLEYTNK